MKCENCLYKAIIDIPDDYAFDTEHALKTIKQEDFCRLHGELCEDAYKGCEYREITVEAQDIQHVINLLSDPALAIMKLKEILGE
jgi:hypothetical protein